MRLDEIGGLVASSSDPGFAAAIAADSQVMAVSESVRRQLIPSLEEMAGGEDQPAPSDPRAPIEPAGPDPQPMHHSRATCRRRP